MTSLPLQTPEHYQIPTVTSVPVLSIASTLANSFALLENGDVLAWGSADILGLSSDDKVLQLVPTPLSGVHDIETIHSCRCFFTIFIDQSGHLHELSYVERGKYGDIKGIDHVREVALGQDGTLIVLKEDGTVWALGAGAEGQLGTGDLSDTTEFVKVPLENVSHIAFTVNLAVAVRNDGTLWAWGRDEEVTGSTEIWLKPKQVLNVHNVQGVAWGDGLSILHTDGSVTVWEEGNFHAVEQIPPIRELDGLYHFYFLGLAEDGTLWTWGSGWVEAAFPVPLPYDRIFGPERFQGHQVDLADVNQVVAGGGDILALDQHGTVWAWGSNTFGELGIGSADRFIKRPTPIIVWEP